MKIALIGAGSFNGLSRDELIAMIREEHPEAEIICQDSSDPGIGLSCDFVIYDEALSVDRMITIPIHAYDLQPPLPRLSGFEKKGRRRGQRRKDSLWSRQ